MASITLTALGFRVSGLPAHTASIDVQFDGVRVWSFDPRPMTQNGDTQVSWPEALRPFLSGTTAFSLRESGSSNNLASIDASFGSGEGRVRVIDAAGEQLSVNKWGRLGKSLEELGADVQQRILTNSLTLVTQLQGLGLRPFVVGGTLLGAVREGRLLPHDDDADIAYLSEHTHPADVALESFRLGKRLHEMGYEFRRHSAAHIQLLFRRLDGSLEHYIDVFSAFFTDDGHINQPFHVRGRMRTSQMLPFSNVDIDGVGFPAPADADAWLSINYDAQWRTPMPGFQIVTPLATRRRFENWFGGMNFRREFWDSFYATDTPDTSSFLMGREWLLGEGSAMRAPVTALLGSGDGRLALDLTQQRPEREVVGVDYSEQALATARALRNAQEDPAVRERLHFEHANLYRLSALEHCHTWCAHGPFDLLANHVIDTLGHRSREQIWRMARMSLASGGQVAFTFHGSTPESDPENPITWHLDPETVASEARGYGLIVECVELGTDPTAIGKDSAMLSSAERSDEASSRLARRTIGARVSLSGER